MKVSMKSLALVLASGLLAMASCNSGNENNTTGDTGTTSENTTSGMDTGTRMDTGMAGSAATANPDQEAINTMVTSNEKEMAWLQAGINNGTSSDVKSHAKMMMADHKKLGTTVSQLITKKGLTKPTVDTTGAVTLTAAKGKEWDK